MTLVRLLVALSCVALMWQANASAQSGYSQFTPPPGSSSAPPVGSTWVAPSTGPTYAQPGVTYGQPYTGVPNAATFGAPPVTYGAPPATYGQAPLTQPNFNAYATPQLAPATPLVPVTPGVAVVGAAPLLTPRAGGGALFGEDVGLDSSSANLYGFIPLLQTPGQSVTFFETRALEFFENNGAHGFNLTGGHRWVSPGLGRVHGGHVGYDFRNTAGFNFSQISFGGESLGEVWDFHLNGFIVVGDERESLPFTNPTFDGNNLVATANFLNAYDGFDGEIGLHLTPDSPSLDTKIYVGGYALYGGTDDTGGIRVRGEITLWDRLTGGVGFQHDSTFDTTFNATVTLLFGGFGRDDTPGIRNVAHRLDDPIRKNAHIVVGRSSQRTTILNPDNGNQPLTILHVDSNAAAGGTGTFEAPLDALPADPSEDIVLAHAGSAFGDEPITLNNAGQRLLGDGATHTVESQFGTLVLPRANNLLATPTITGVTGDAVTIAADGVEVSNFEIVSPTGDGIVGAGVSDVDINRNTITGADNGIALAGTVSGSIRNNVASGNAGDGIVIGDWSEGDITDNAATGNGADGYSITTLSGGEVTGNSAIGNQIGFTLGDIRDPARVADNTSSGNQTGFDIALMSGGVLEENQAAGNTLVGFAINALNDGEMRANSSTNPAAGADGFTFDTIAGGSITENRAENNGEDGFELTTSFTAGDFSDNVANNNGAAGYTGFPTPPVDPATAEDNTGTGNTTPGTDVYP